MPAIKKINNESKLTEIKVRSDIKNVNKLKGIKLMY